MQLDKSALSPMQRGRLDKSLAVQYRFNSVGIMTLGEYVTQTDFDRKTDEVKYHARHKRQGEYKILKNPRHVYTLWDGDAGIDVPKIVYNLAELPETIKDPGPPRGYAQRQKPGMVHLRW